MKKTFFCCVAWLLLLSQAKAQNSWSPNFNNPDEHPFIKEGWYEQLGKGELSLREIQNRIADRSQLIFKGTIVKSINYYDCNYNCVKISAVIRVLHVFKGHHLIKDNDSIQILMNKQEANYPPIDLQMTLKGLVYECDFPAACQSTKTSHGYNYDNISDSGVFFANPTDAICPIKENINNKQLICLEYNKGRLTSSFYDDMFGGGFMYEYLEHSYENMVGHILPDSERERFQKMTFSGPIEFYEWLATRKGVVMSDKFKNFWAEQERIAKRDYDRMDLEQDTIRLVSQSISKKANTNTVHIAIQNIQNTVVGTTQKYTFDIAVMAAPNDPDTYLHDLNLFLKYSTNEFGQNIATTSTIVKAAAIANNNTYDVSLYNNSTNVLGLSVFFTNIPFTPNRILVPKNTGLTIATVEIITQEHIYTHGFDVLTTPSQPSNAQFATTSTVPTKDKDIYSKYIFSIAPQIKSPY